MILTEFAEMSVSLDLVCSIWIKGCGESTAAIDHDMNLVGLHHFTTTKNKSGKTVKACFFGDLYWIAVWLN